MTSFLLALQFLTIIPFRIRGVSDKKIARSLIYFPIAGLFIGAALAGINYCLAILGMNPLTRAVILAVSLIALTGGIHLDGLSDTLDAILSRKDSLEMLAVMRDSHAGVMGVLGITSALLLKIALLSSIDSRQPLFSALALVCILSRWGMVEAIFLFPYARGEGKAKPYFSGINPQIFTASTVIALGCAVVLTGISGLIVMAITAAAVYLAAKFLCKKIGGLTGDTLGALNECAEIIILFAIVILQRSGIWIIV